MNNKLQKAVRQMHRTDLTSFIRMGFDLLYPCTTYQSHWSIPVLAHYLNRCVEGKCKRLIINMLPRYLKSFAASVASPRCTLRIPALRWRPFHVSLAQFAMWLALLHCVGTGVFLGILDMIGRFLDWVAMSHVFEHTDKAHSQPITVRSILIQPGFRRVTTQNPVWDTWPDRAWNRLNSAIDNRLCFAHNAKISRINRHLSKCASVDARDLYV